MSFRLGVSWPPSSVQTAAQDGEPANRLGLRHGLVGLLHGSLDLGAEIGILEEVGDVAGLAVLLGPGRQGLGIDRDQRGDEGLAVADHEALVDEVVGAEPVLEHGGGDVLAAGRHQDLLLAAGDPHEPLVVDLTDVPGVEPAVVVLGLGGRLLVVPVAGEDLAAAEQQLAVVGDAHAGALERAAHGARPSGRPGGWP